MPRKETSRKEPSKNGSEQKAKLSTPTQAIDARMGEEEGNRKQKEEQKKYTRSEPQPRYLGHVVASYNPQGSYGGPILETTRPQGEWSERIQ